MIVGEGTYELQGTEAQQQIFAGCFEPGSPYFIRFPWAKLSPPATPIPIGWQDLNGALAHHSSDAHTVTRSIEGREFVAGVFWTDGRIYIDYRCETNPDLAREVMSAELAHSVDYFLPLTEVQKKDLMFLWHGGRIDEHSWWERADYSGEYYDLGGEAFMAAFTLAYSRLTPDQSAFTHKLREEDVPRVREIVGVDEPIMVVRISNRPRYHRASCVYVRMARAVSHRTTELELDAALLGLVPCRRCKP